jgi:hypothetical protein
MWMGPARRPDSERYHTHRICLLPMCILLRITWDVGLKIKERSTYGVRGFLMTVELVLKVELLLNQPVNF